MNDKLREALAIVEKYGMKGDVIYKEIEALAASKPEPSIVLTNAYRADIDRAKRDDLEASKAIFSKQEPQSTMVDKQSTKPEPQAQAEPEVVALMEKARLWVAAVSENLPLPEMRKAMEGLETALNKTLQSHRESIAKKDAALKACVEALHKSKQNILASAHGFYEEYGTTKQTLDEFLDKQLIAEIDAAITQAKEARK